jgi:thiol-disulfide isomerase/thioredoxin
MRPSWIYGLLVLGLAACSAAGKAGQTDRPAASASPQAQLDSPSLPDMGPAPELTNTIWLNTDHPLRLADLRGKVVALDMWTFGCINCQHVIPSLQNWYRKYGSQGLVIIGNHFPEFDYERNLDNLKAAVVNLDVPYPVCQDNAGATWRAYNNNYWPTLYLIDKRGHLRYIHIGEGAYDESEVAIQALLAEPYSVN